MPTTVRTRVAIVGGGPAGLMLSHLLARSRHRLRRRRPPHARARSRQTHRAGILEQDSVRLLVEPGSPTGCCATATGTRASTCAFGGRGPPHRLQASSGRRAGSTRRPTCSSTSPTPAPRRRRRALRRHATRGRRRRRRPRPASCSPTPTGSRPRGPVRLPRRRRRVAQHLPPRLSRSRPRRQYFREYPFAWFGILCEAPPSAPELIYTHSDRGVRADQPAHRDAAADVLPVRPGRGRRRLVRRPDLGGAPGPASAPTASRLNEGPITRTTVLPFRSFVQEPMRHGRLLLAGDAAHTVPPTGAKGLNLALADVRVLAEGSSARCAKNDASLARRLHRAAPSTGSGGPSTSPTG